MNQKKAKRLRKYIKEKLPFALDFPVYKQQGGTVVLDERCQRHHYQRTKKNIKRGM